MTTWMDLEDIVLSEISQTQILLWSHLYVKTKKKKTTEVTYTMKRLVVTSVEGGMGKQSEGGEKVQVYIYDKSWGCNVQHGDFTAYLKVAKRS